MIDSLARKPDVPTSAAADFEAAFASSPYLEQLALAAIERRQLDHLAVSRKPHESGSLLTAGGLTTVAVEASIFSEKDRQTRLDAIVGTLAHEIRHAMNAKLLDEKQREYSTQVWNALVEGGRDPSEAVNLTEASRTLQTWHRYDEATAAVASFNALASRVMHEKQGGFDEAEVLRRAKTSPCVIGGQSRSPQLAPGLTFNERGVMATHGAIDERRFTHAANPNVEAAAKCYFDAPADQARLGTMGVSDYANYYAAGMVATIAAHYASLYSAGDERAPEVRLDLASLGWDVKQIEAAGLNLGKRNDFSVQNGDAFNLATFHTTLTHAQARPSLQTAENIQPPIASAPGLVSTLNSASPSDSAHPVNAALQHIRAGVHALQVGGVGWDAETQERISRSLLAASKDNREMYPNAPHGLLSHNALQRVDHVVIASDGQHVFAVEGALRDPSHRRAAVNVQQASQTPIEVSDGKLAAANQLLAQESAMTHRRQRDDVQQRHAQPDQQGPSLTR